MKGSLSVLFVVFFGTFFVACSPKEEKSPDQLRAQDSTLSYAQKRFPNVLHKSKDSIRFANVKKMEGYRNGQKAPTEYLLYYLADVVDTNMIFDMETGAVKEKQAKRRSNVKIEVWLDSTFAVKDYKIPDATAVP